MIGKASQVTSAQSDHKENSVASPNPDALNLVLDEYASVASGALPIPSEYAQGWMVGLRNAAVAFGADEDLFDLAEVVE